MTDRPITFSGPMVRALLAGTKTQTRRAINPRGRLSLFDGTWSDSYVLNPGNADWRAKDVRISVGDRLYVREHWRADTAYDGTPPRELSSRVALWFEADGGTVGDGVKGKFRQAMHMPKWASRITLHVTEVRVQRLQEISDSDSFAEGIPTDAPVAGFEIDIDGYWWAGAPRNRYRKVWEAINGPHSWDANPWVTATTFEVERCHIDQARAA